MKTVMAAIVLLVALWTNDAHAEPAARPGFWDQLATQFSVGAGGAATGIASRALISMAPHIVGGAMGVAGLGVSAAVQYATTGRIDLGRLVAGAAAAGLLLAICNPATFGAAIAVGVIGSYAGELLWNWMKRPRPGAQAAAPAPGNGVQLLSHQADT